MNSNITILALCVIQAAVFSKSFFEKDVGDDLTCVIKANYNSITV
jgi:hypothetical protein